MGLCQKSNYTMETLPFYHWLRFALPNVVSEYNEEFRPSGHEMFRFVQHDKEKVKITFGTTL